MLYPTEDNDTPLRGFGKWWRVEIVVVSVVLSLIQWADVLAVLGLAVGSLVFLGWQTPGESLCLPGGGCPIEVVGPDLSIVAVVALLLDPLVVGGRVSAAGGVGCS